MAGNSPFWLKADHRAVVEGQPQIVTGWRWVGASGPNSDELLISFKGLSREFNILAVDPLPVNENDLPDYVRENKKVRHTQSGDICTVENIWLEDNAKTGKKTICLRVHRPGIVRTCTLDDIAPLTPQAAVVPVRHPVLRKSTLPKL